MTMKQYLIYKSSTGEVLSAPSCSADQTMHIPPQWVDAEIIEIDFVEERLEAKGYVDVATKQFIRFNTEQEQGKADSGIYGSTWSYETKEWIPDSTKVLAHRKSVMLEQAQLRLSKELSEPVLVEGELVNNGKLSADSLSIKLQELLAATEFGKPCSELFWRMYDNTHKEFATTAEMVEWVRTALLTISLNRTETYSIWWNRKNEINEATSVEELEEINIPPL